MKKSKSYLNYYQPDFYRFSEDSLILSRFVSDYIKKNKSDSYRCLDLCSGCGVIGLEIIRNSLGKYITFDFCEVQKEYESFFYKNLELDRKKIEKATFLNISFTEILTKEYKSKYDLIVSNPPYFNEGEGRPSPNEMKNICRFFLRGSVQEWAKTISYCLSESGIAFFVCRFSKEVIDKLFEQVDKGLECNLEISFSGANLFSVISLNV